MEFGAVNASHEFSDKDDDEAKECHPPAECPKYFKSKDPVNSYKFLNLAYESLRTIHMMYENFLEQK